MLLELESGLRRALVSLCVMSFVAVAVLRAHILRSLVSRFSFLVFRFSCVVSGAWFLVSRISYLRLPCPIPRFLISIPSAHLGVQSRRMG